MKCGPTHEVVPLNLLSRIADWTVRRLFIACAFVVLSLPSHVRADEEEQGLSYACDSTQQELKISSLWKSGGGAEDPFTQFEKDGHALWNIDRMDKSALPIIKTCQLGRHKIYVVISIGCVAGDGFSPRVSLYANADPP
jgi:hypothetical protein